MLGLLNTVLSKGNTLLTYVKDGLVMANRFLTPPKLTFPVDASAEFNGTSDYILIKDDGKGSAFDTQTFTISAWVNAKTLGDNIIWSYDYTSHTAPYYAQQFRLMSTGRVYFGWNNNGSIQNIEAPVNSYEANKWHHVAFTMKAGEQRIYVDGSIVVSSALSPTITYYNQEVWISKSNFGGEFDGNMANVAFWNRALSSDEINSVMWKSYEQISATESNGLQAWYKLSASEALSGDSTATLTTYANANGLTFEAPACVQTALNAFPDITDARLYSANYDIRVKADGGNVESLNCVETELNALLV